jgi:hypothetical protein
MARSLTPAPAATSRWVRPARPRSRSARSRKPGEWGSGGALDIGIRPCLPSCGSAGRIASGRADAAPQIIPGSRLVDKLPF